MVKAACVEVYLISKAGVGARWYLKSMVYVCYFICHSKSSRKHGKDEAVSSSNKPQENPRKLISIASDKKKDRKRTPAYFPYLFRKPTPPCLQIL
jgi:hypothetical protein